MKLNVRVNEILEFDLVEFKKKERYYLNFFAQ